MNEDRLRGDEMRLALDLIIKYGIETAKEHDWSLPMTLAVTLGGTLETWESVVHEQSLWIPKELAQGVSLSENDQDSTCI